MLKNHRGFSMIELAVALTIMGLLLAMGLPGFSAWTRGANVKNAADSVNNGLQLARLEAIKRNTSVTFWLVSLTNVNEMDNTCAKSASGISWVVSLDDPSGGCATSPSDTTSPRIIQSHPGGTGNATANVQGTSGGNAAYCVTFNGLGQVLPTCKDGATPISQVLASVAGDSGIRTQQVSVSSGGAIRTCDPNVSSSSDPRKC